MEDQPGTGEDMKKEKFKEIHSIKFVVRCARTRTNFSTYGFADTGTTEESDLSSLGVRGEEIHDLNSSDENLLGFALKCCRRWVREREDETVAGRR